MKFNVLEGIINYLNQTDKELRDSSAKIKKLQEELNEFQNQRQNDA